MKKLILITIWFLATPTVAIAGNYRIINFASEMTISRNTALTIRESISTIFLEPMHGIYRDIPIKKLKVNSVTDKSGQEYQYSKSVNSSGTRIKIGDPDVTSTGPHDYLIEYEVPYAVQKFADHDELYWNVTGSKWDTEIESSSVVVNSPFATINRAECFAGVIGSQERHCHQTADAAFVSTVPVGVGQDFTVVVGLARPNSLQFPGPLEQIWNAGWGWYLLVLSPGLFAALRWYRHGRDEKYTGDNIYYRPEGAQTETVSPFKREHLPLVYSPIKDLTPAEAGTIIDQKVHLSDVVAEIMELARLEYLKVSQVKKDYQFERTAKAISGLKAHQILLLAALTKPEYLEGRVYKLSLMKNKFYQDLNKFKDSLYQGLASQGLPAGRQAIFAGRPDTIRSGWIWGTLIVQFILVQVVAPIVSWVIPVGIISGLTAAIFGYAMPRRTAWGHSLYRQLVGLKYYVGKGKWRYEIAEKHLFLEEILPLAISLGVINQLTHDMAVLKMQPPSYMGNVTPSHFGSFQNSMGSTLASTPSSKGSGFGGGGSSGGGGGGGGGGGW